MRKRIDFSRENRPFSYYARIPLLHSVDSMLFPIDTGYSFMLRGIMSRHNGFSAGCSESVSFLPGAVNIGADEITLSGRWRVNASVRFTTTGALPPPLAVGTPYFIRSNVGGVVTLSNSYGGGLLDITGVGAGVHTIHAAMSPTLGVKIQRVSSGEGEFQDSVIPELFVSPGSSGCGVYAEPSPYTRVPSNYGVSFTATPRKLARVMDSFFIAGESIQILVSGQEIRSTTEPLDNSPSYIDVMLVGRHYPDTTLPAWAARGHS